MPLSYNQDDIGKVSQIVVGVAHLVAQSSGKMVASLDSRLPTRHTAI